MVISEVDLLPEEVDWRDEGCELFPACLDCPFSRCVEEEPRARQRLKAVLRSAQMKALRRKGRSIREIAGLFGVSQRTVQRALGKSKIKNQNTKGKMTSQKSENVPSASMEGRAKPYVNNFLASILPHLFPLCTILLRDDQKAEAAKAELEAMQPSLFDF